MFNESTGEMEGEIMTVGIFDSEEKAVNSCIDPGYSIAMLILNEAFPHERIEITDEDYYYPWLNDNDELLDFPVNRHRWEQ
jgi:hypothetical protein